MRSRTTTTSHRPSRLAAILTSALAGMLLSLVALPAAATPPFALPDQITDQVGAIEGHTAEIQAALDDLEAGHGIRMWVVFVDTFDGTDPQTWADETFTATGLGTEDYLLAVAMTARQYGYVVDQGFALDAAALARVATAAERHLAENPARAVTSTAAQLAIERPTVSPSASAATDETGSPAWQPWAIGVGVAVALATGLAAVLTWNESRTSQGKRSFFAGMGQTNDRHWDSDSTWPSSGSGSYGGGGTRGGSGSYGGGGTRGGSGSF